MYYEELQNNYGKLGELCRKRVKLMKSKRKYTVINKFCETQTLFYKQNLFAYL